MKNIKTGLVLWLVAVNLAALGQGPDKVVPQAVMERIYNEVRTPYKYGIVLPQPDQGRMVDSPTIYRKEDTWFMSYIIFDGKGYETWLARSDDLLHWQTAGKLMSFTDTGWDATQKAGYVSLIDTDWGGSYAPGRYNGNYWLSYLGGSEKGYEAGRLGVGIATTADLTKAVEADRKPGPVLSAIDPDARPYDNNTIYKSLIIRDKEQKTGYPFVMYYNAKGDEKDVKGNRFESIAMAVSTDMVTWKRLGQEPLISRRTGICGDAQIAKIGNVYVMFYFGAFWKPGAFDRFACSYDLMHWTDWQGPDLIAPSEPFDKTYAHKPWVIKWNGVVYHFYNAVGSNGRVIAVATSTDVGKSDIRDK
ncbi:glycosylase [Arsenicibacter rosenii]|uniref:Glycosylase n=1 Tax=Arsenicibacter rosenii TaxID=1750698 RepID=A0A1S2VPQ6_9BACT|nr:glycosylase [Arsenicibacter rosenii]OIN60751.1 glycosylase [Arsenicibacter rosenii]